MKSIFCLKVDLLVCERLLGRLQIKKTKGEDNRKTRKKKTLTKD